LQLDGLIASAPEVLRAHLLVDLIRTALVSRGAGFRVSTSSSSMLGPGD
jgi:hypothetical protein